MRLPSINADIQLQRLSGANADVYKKLQIALFEAFLRYSSYSRPVIP